jgi:hypothetical protein
MGLIEHFVRLAANTALRAYIWKGSKYENLITFALCAVALLILESCR